MIKLGNHTRRARCVVYFVVAAANIFFVHERIEASDCQDTCLAACPRHSGTFSTPEVDKACAMRCLQLDCSRDRPTSPIPVPPAKTAVDDQIVKKWIERGFAADTCVSPSKNERDLNNADSPESVSLAWRYLKQCRDRGNSSDLNLAAAENYLFIRFVASETGDTFYEILPKWYYTLKVAASKVAFLDLLKTSSQPVSEPNMDVLRWGNLGYQHGIRDYEKRAGIKATKKTDALITGLSFLVNRYY